jgi:2-polyprenyl-3-methyl-5-hydroxy-6-metoxy-1,4-benzoquinol methylase
MAFATTLPRRIVRRLTRWRRDVRRRVEVALANQVAGTPCKVCSFGQLIFLEKKLNIDGSVNHIYLCDSCSVVTNLSAFAFDESLQAHASATYYKLDDEDTAEIAPLIDSHQGLVAYATRFLGGAEGRSLLEIGTGRGTLLVAAKRLGYRQAVGVDLNLATFEALKARFPVDDDIVVYKDIEEIRERFDCVVMWHTLEHIPEPRAYLEKVALRLKEGGILFLQVPQYYQPYICSTHYHFYNEPSIRKLMAATGFQVLELGYDLKNQFTTVVARYDPGRVKAVVAAVDPLQ